MESSVEAQVPASLNSLGRAIREHQQITSSEETMEALVPTLLNPLVFGTNIVLGNIEHRLSQTIKSNSSNPTLHCAQYSSAENTSTVGEEILLYVSYFDDVGREEEIIDQDSTSLLEP